MPTEFKRQNQLIIADREDIGTVGDKISELIKEQKEKENEVAMVRVSLTNAMEKFGVDKWTTPNGTQITYIPETNKEDNELVFNVEKFKAEHFDLYKEYLENKTKKTSRAACIRVTLPKGNNNG